MWDGVFSICYKKTRAFPIRRSGGDQTPVLILDNAVTPVLIQSDILPVLPTGVEYVFGDAGFLYFRDTPGDEWWGACSGGGCVAFPLVLQPAE